MLVIDLHGNDISLVFLKRRGFVWVLTNHAVQALIGVLQVSGTRQVHWQDLLLVLDLGGHRSKELFQYLELQETNILCEQSLIAIHLEQVKVGPKKEFFSMFRIEAGKPWIANVKEANIRCTWLRGNVLLIHSRSGLRIRNMPPPWIDGDKTCRFRVSQELVANCT